MIFRLASLFVFVLSLGTSAYFRHRARALGPQIRRSAEGPRFATIRAVVALPLFTGPVLYMANPEWMRWSSFELPAFLRWTGVALGVLVVPLIHWVFRSLGSNVSETVLTKEGQRLVTGGPYRWVRHPLYSSGITLFLAIGLMAANWFILLFALVAATLIRYVVVPREEGELLRKFGDAYREYMGRTGRLLPRL